MIDHYQELSANLKEARMKVAELKRENERLRDVLRMIGSLLGLQVMHHLLKDSQGNNRPTS